MKRNFFAGICVLTAALLTPGCFNSEEEYNSLTEEVASLTAELETAHKEKEILVQALKNIEGEKARLKTALVPYEPAPAAGEGAATAPDAAPAGGSAPLEGGAVAAPGAQAGSARVHVAQRGDTLSNIAIRYNTDMNTLLDLNPYLRQRNSFMVWEEDKIQLPGPTPPPASPAPEVNF